jgi:hypothetical protein
LGSVGVNFGNLVVSASAIFSFYRSRFSTISAIFSQFFCCFFLRCFLYAVVTLRAVDGYLLWIRN